MTEEERDRPVDEQIRLHQEKMGCDGKCEDCTLHDKNGEGLFNNANDLSALLHEADKSAGEIFKMAAERMPPRATQLLSLSLAVKYSIMAIKWPGGILSDDLKTATFVFLKRVSRMEPNDMVSMINYLSKWEPSNDTD